jgi:hypothetical protein
LREEDDLTETLQRTEPALRNTIVFLKRDAGVPHLALVPEPVSLVLLARFFHLHPEPTPRSRELLTRWFWRGSVLGRYWDDKTPAAHLFLAAGPLDEEHAVQAMLAQVRKPSPRALDQYVQPLLAGFLPPTDRVAMNALLTLHPRHLLTGAPVDPVQLFEEHGASALRPLFTSPPAEAPPGASPMEAALPDVLLATLANHLFHPPLPGQELLDVLRGPSSPAPEVLLSHAIAPGLLPLLRHERITDFLAQRQKFLGAHIAGFVRAHTRYEESDRPSLQSLIVEDEED